MPLLAPTSPQPPSTGGHRGALLSARCMAVVASLLVAGLSLVASPVRAGTAHVGIAANVAAPMKRIAEAFARDTGHQALVSVGATGKLYAQIRNGAPFDLLLAADETTPARLLADGLAVAESRFTYAIGRLVLWSARPDLVDGHGAVLRHGRFEKLAIAAPKVAPYGTAAMQTMERMGLLQALRPRLVQGESIGQAFNFVATGNAELGFVALSQVQIDGRITQGSAWVVPQTLHAPLRQDAVLLRRGQHNAAATALMAYLRSESARSILRGYGYTD